MSLLSSPLSWLILLITAAILFIFAYSFFAPAHTLKPTPKEPPAKKAEERAGTAGVCPVCRTALQKNEQIRTRVYQGSGDCTCLVYGCPHCYPFPEPNITRRCPVCHMQVHNADYLVARLLDRSFGKHVRIKGCKLCQKGY